MGRSLPAPKFSLVFMRDCLKGRTLVKNRLHITALIVVISLLIAGVIKFDIMDKVAAFKKEQPVVTNSFEMKLVHFEHDLEIQELIFEGTTHRQFELKNPTGKPIDLDKVRTFLRNKNLTACNAPEVEQILNSDPRFGDPLPRIINLTDTTGTVLSDEGLGADIEMSAYIFAR